VASDESDSFVISRTGNGDWGQGIGHARLEKDNSGVSPVIGASADIAFAEGYSAAAGDDSCVQYIAIDSGCGQGDVYAVFNRETPDDSLAVDLDISAAYGIDNVDIAGLDVSGQGANAVLLVGAADDNQVYRSYDGGSSWLKSQLAPTGLSATQVVMSDGFVAGGVAYVSTSGAESALSISDDGGLSWHQLGLIDTTVEALVDLAVSPRYDYDATIFLLTWGGTASLWRSNDDGWQRLFSSALGGVDGLDYVALSPQYGGGSRVVYLAGYSDGQPAIWRSADNGRSFERYEVPLPADCWVMADDDTLF